MLSKKPSSMNSRLALRGDLLQPGDAAYDTTRKVWNEMVDKRPALIVRCKGVADVIAACALREGATSCCWRCAAADTTSRATPCATAV